MIGPELKKASNVGRLLNSSASLEELRHAFVASVGDVSNDSSPPAAVNNTASGFPADQLVKLLLTFGPAESPVSSVYSYLNGLFLQLSKLLLHLWRKECSSPLFRLFYKCSKHVVNVYAYTASDGDWRWRVDK